MADRKGEGTSKVLKTYKNIVEKQGIRKGTAMYRAMKETSKPGKAPPRK